jgi:hypothetical protein
MQRLSSGLVATLPFMPSMPSKSIVPIKSIMLIVTLLALPACKGESSDGKADSSSAKSSDAAQPDGREPAAGQDTADTKVPAVDDGAATAGPADPAASEGGAVAPADTGGAEAGAAEPPAGPDPAVLLAMAANLDTDDATATSSLNDAVAAGAAKLDVAKVANTRGEALLTKGESERAEPFFVWARDAHNLFSEPVYNLAKLAAYAGDLEIAKEHLAELEKRGNKKLMKKVGVEPAFTPLLDDPDVRKLFEQ